MKTYLVRSFLFLVFVSTVPAFAARVGEIDKEDSTAVQVRIKSRRFSTFGFGPQGSNVIGSNKLLYGFSAGKDWETKSNAGLRATAFGASNPDGQFLSLMLGLSYLPLTTDTSPVIGAEVGGAYAHYGENGHGRHRFGYAGGVFAGARFFRTSDTQLEIVANYNVLFEKDTPGVYGAQLRLLY